MKVGVANPQYSHAERGEAPSATYPGGHPTPNSYRMNTKSKADDNQNAKSTKKVKKVGGIAKTAGKVLGGFFGEALDGMDSDDWEHYLRNRVIFYYHLLSLLDFTFDLFCHLFI